MRAVIWPAGGTAVGDFGTLDGNELSTSFAYSINENGVVVGKSQAAGVGSVYHALESGS